MTEIHPSFTGLGEFMDEETEIAVLAQRYYEEEGRPVGRSLEHWSRAEREVRARHSVGALESGGAKPLTGPDLRTEEEMQFGA